MRVLVLGMPKSGTTFLFARLAQARGLDPQQPGPTAFFEPEPQSQWPKSATAKALLVDPEGGWGSRCAEPFRGWTVDQALEQGTHFDVPILLLRDPRDRWLSAFFYRWLYLHDPDPADFHRALRLVQHKEAHPEELSFADLVCPRGMDRSAWLNDLALRMDRLARLEHLARERGWCVVRYEDVRRGDFSGLEQRLPVEWKLLPDGEQSRNFNHIARTRGFGNWKRWWLPSDEALFRPIWQHHLERWGYETEAPWPFDIPDELPSSEGSEYMSGLFHHENGPHASFEQKKAVWKRSVKSMLLGRSG